MLISDALEKNITGVRFKKCVEMNSYREIIKVESGVKYDLRISFLSQINLYLFISGLLLLSLYDGHHANDTSAVVDGARHIAVCLSSRPIQVPCPGVSHFPIIQYVPSYFGVVVGLSDSAILRSLTVLNFLSLFGVYFLSVRVLRSKMLSVEQLLGFILMASPLLYYSRSSFSEGFSALLITWFVVECIQLRSIWKIAGACTLAGLTKETAWPFLLLIGMGVLFEAPIPKSRRSSALFACFFGVLASLFISTAFNLFRFDSAYNLNYLTSLYQVHRLKYFVSNLLTIWLSPNGGLVVYWPTWFILLFYVASKFKRSPANLACIIALAGLTLGFAKWHTPLGFIAWGPRLILPWTPGILLIVLWVGAQEVETVLKKWSSHFRLFWIGVAVLIAVALPHGLVLIDTRPFGHILEANEACPKTPRVERDPEYFNRCIQYSHWPARPMWIDAYRDLSEPVQLGVALSYAFALFGFALSYYRSISGVPQKTRQRA